MVQSLVDSLRPLSRVQPRPVDVVLRATQSTMQQTYRGSTVIMQWEMSAFAAWVATFQGDSNAFTFEGSNDGNSWAPIDCWPMGRNVSAPVGMLAGFYQENSGGTIIGGNRQTRFMRVRVISAAGSRWAAMQVLLAQHPLTPPRSQMLGPDDTWEYVAASGGIVNTTPVTLKTAVNAYHRNVLTRLQLANGGASGTEVIISDGSTRWRDYLAAGAVRSVDFNPPLRAAANGAITLTLSSGTNVAVYANAQGVVGLA